MTRRLAALLVLATATATATPLACEGEGACEEDIRAQVIDERVEITVDGAALLAELADETVERDRGWKHRRCDREALLFVPDAPGEALPIWGCALVEAVDVVFIADGQAQAVEALAPCPEPCDACPIVGEGLPVDAVLELPAGSGVEVGDAVQTP